MLPKAPLDGLVSRPDRRRVGVGAELARTRQTNEQPEILRCLYTVNKACRRLGIRQGRTEKLAANCKPRRANHTYLQQDVDEELQGELDMMRDWYLELEKCNARADLARLIL